MGYEDEDGRPMGPIQFMERCAQVAACIAGVFAVACIVLSLERAS